MFALIKSLLILNIVLIRQCLNHFQNVTDNLNKKLINLYILLEFVLGQILISIFIAPFTHNFFSTSEQPFIYLFSE